MKRMEELAKGVTRGAPGRFGGSNVKRATSAVSTGRVFSLNRRLDTEIAPFGRGTFQRSVRLHNDLRPIDDGKYVVINDDEVSFALQGSSQWDAFSHFGVIDPSADGVYLDGVGLSETYPEPYAKELGLQSLGPAIVARGIILDLAASLGEISGFLAGDVRISREDVEECIHVQGIKVEPGDVVLLYTGFENRQAALGGTVP